MKGPPAGGIDFDVVCSSPTGQWESAKPWLLQDLFVPSEHSPMWRGCELAASRQHFPHHMLCKASVERHVCAAVAVDAGDRPQHDIQVTPAQLHVLLHLRLFPKRCLNGVSKDVKGPQLIHAPTATLPWDTPTALGRLMLPAETPARYGDCRNDLPPDKYPSIQV